MSRWKNCPSTCFEDMAGQRVGILSVLSYVEGKFGSGARWLCQCDCGKQIIANRKSLRNKQYSCGCVRLGKRTHNLTGSPTYGSWVEMRRRCSNPKRPEYKDYGGRGITVCKRWGRFENFLADMGEMPVGYSIERINNNLGYSKKNCCWIPRSEQAKNRRSVRWFNVGGERVTMTEASRRLGVNVTTLLYRLHAGWPMKRILSSTVR
jgi:hypothetical protein